MLAQVCSPTDRPISDIKNIFMPPAQYEDGMSTEFVVRSKLFSSSSGFTQMKGADSTHFPGRVSVGDISSDGYPDILMTMKAENGTSSAFLMLNSPCTHALCSEEAKDSKRRVFKPVGSSYEKFLADD